MSLRYSVGSLNKDANIYASIHSILRGGGNLRYTELSSQTYLDVTQPKRQPMSSNTSEHRKSKGVGKLRMPNFKNVGEMHHHVTK